MLINFFQLLFRNNRRGSALVMVLIASIALAAFALVLMQRQKTETNMNIKDAAEKDFQAAIAKISSLLIAPSDCNANFAGAAKSGTPTILYSCSTATVSNCRPGTKVEALRVETGRWYFAGAPSKVRVTGMSYATLNQMAGTPPKPGVVTLTVNLQKNLGMVNSAVRTQTLTRTFNASVATGTYNYTTKALVQSTTIIGCTKSQSSTLAY